MVKGEDSKTVVDVTSSNAVQSGTPKLETPAEETNREFFGGRNLCATAPPLPVCPW